MNTAKCSPNDYLQPPLLEPLESDWAPPTEFPSWAAAPRIGLDVETCDPQLKKLGPGPRRKGSYLVGISLAFDDGPMYYYPIRHAGGDNLSPPQVLAYFRDQAKTYTGVVAGANLSYDLDWLAQERIHFPLARFRDVQIADPLINELHDSYSLDSILKRWSLPLKQETLLRQAAGDWHINPKTQMWQLPARYVGRYAEQDARLPLSLLDVQEREIDHQNLRNIYELECELLPVLVKLRRRGIRIDLDKLDQVERWAYAEEEKALNLVHDKTGYRLGVGSVWKADALAPVIESRGIEVGVTPKTRKPSIKKELFFHHQHDEVMSAIAYARKVNKLRTTFAASIRDHLCGERIHCTFNQLRRAKEGEHEDQDAGAAYGRLSCEHPNLQQQPSRDEFAKQWRSIYLPEEGEQWAACDFSQQEPRMTVHYACVAGPNTIGEDAHVAALRARDAYRNDPNTDNHQMMADMAGIPRKVAKNIFLGLCYGMGGAKLCRELGLPTRWVVRSSGRSWSDSELFDVSSPEGKRLLHQGAHSWEAAGLEGQELLDKFDKEVPFVRRLAKACENVAKKRGFITTLLGRRCRFPLKDGKRDWAHKALNRLIQGSSADQTKRAMVEMDRAGYDLIVQVHDEVAVSVTSKAQAEAAAEIMRTCVELELPSKVDVEIGDSWGGSM